MNLRRMIITKRCKFISGAAVPSFASASLYASLLCVAMIAYRVTVFGYIAEYHAGARLRGVAEYLALCARSDSIALFAVVSLIAILSLILAPRPMLRHALCVTVTLLAFVFLLAAAEFFRIYETTFQPSYAGREHVTAIGSMVRSSLFELTPRFYLGFLFAMAALAAAALALTRFERRLDDASSASRPRQTRILLPASFVPMLCVSLIITAIISNPSAKMKEIAGRSGQDAMPRQMSLLHELALNPITAVIHRTNHVLTRDTVDSGKAHFTFGLRTDSMADSRRFARRSAVPRRFGYNIILYFFESTPYKYYRLSVSGRPVMSNWHRLERHALNFTNHYANYPLSANALFSVFTSAYDLLSKEMIIEQHPDVALKTLPEILSSHGYRTCLVHSGGLGYAGQRRFLKHRRFDAIIDYQNLVNRTPYNTQVGWGIDERAMIGPAIEFAARDPHKPFFLVVMPVNPHHPYAIPGPEFDITSGVSKSAPSKKQSWWHYLNSLYYADASMGMLVDAFEREGLLDNTLLFLFADHGEAFYQHRMNYNHPFFLYEENVHVPFLIYNRRFFPSPEYYDATTRHIDIAPTILDILGLPRPHEYEGVALLGPHQAQMALLHTSWKDDYLGIKDGPWKYILRTSDGLEELYHCMDDPDERRNLVASRPEVAERYRRFIAKAKQYRAEYWRRILARPAIGSPVALSEKRSPSADKGKKSTTAHTQHVND